MATDFYAVLGVVPEADAEQITRAFRRLIRTLHPDAVGSESGGGQGTGDQATGDQAAGERLAQVLAAWRVLHDPAARSAYDNARREAETPTKPGAVRRESGIVMSRGDDAFLVAGPPVVHDRRTVPATPHLRVGPPVRLDDRPERGK